MEEESQSFEFDVFLAHNSKDKAAVRDICQKLKNKGFKPWLDEEQVAPGQSFLTKIATQIDLIPAVIVFLGPNGEGPWHEKEIEAFLIEVVSRGCVIIPVILVNVKGQPVLPPFLRGNRFVDFRVGSPDPLELLIWGINAAVSPEKYQDSPRSNEPEVNASNLVVDVLLHTVDRTPQLSEIKAARSDDSQSNKHCFVFECSRQDIPEYLAHHLQIKPDLDNDRVPVGQSKGEVQAQNLGEIHTEGEFETQITSDIGDGLNPFIGEDQVNVLYLSVTSLAAIEKVSSDIQSVLAKLNKTHPQIEMTVLVAFFGRLCPRWWQCWKTRWWQCWKVNPLENTGVFCLPPLELLTYDHLDRWVDNLPDFLSVKLNDKEALKDSFERCFGDEKKAVPYRVIRGKVKQCLLKQCKS